jgi:hypothetical protein
MQTQKISLEKYQQTELEVKAREAKTGFKINLTAYAAINTLLAIVNMLTLPSFLWFVFPLSGWGIGLTMHYIFGVHLFSKIVKAEQAKIEQAAIKAN